LGELAIYGWALNNAANALTFANSGTINGHIDLGINDLNINGADYSRLTTVPDGDSDTEENTGRSSSSGDGCFIGTILE